MSLRIAPNSILRLNSIVRTSGPGWYEVQLYQAGRAWRPDAFARSVQTLHLMAEIITAFVWELLELFLAITGQFLVWALSFGRWRSESLRENESRVFAAAGALSFVREGQRVITSTGLVFLAWLFTYCSFFSCWSMQQSSNRTQPDPQRHAALA